MHSNVSSLHFVQFVFLEKIQISEIKGFFNKFIELRIAFLRTLCQAAPAIHLGKHLLNGFLRK